MKIELQDKNTDYKVMINFTYRKTTLATFIRLINKGVSARKVLKGILDKENWNKVKKLKLTRDSYESLLSTIAEKEIFPKLDDLAKLSKRFNKRYGEFASMYMRDKQLFEDILEEYLND